MITLPPTIATRCPECESTNLIWDHTPNKLTDVVNGRLTTHDVETLFYLGCGTCGETLAHLSPDNLAAILNQPSNRLCTCDDIIPAAARLRVVDAALFPGATPPPDHQPDYRLELDTPTGGEVCLPREADAAYAVRVAYRDGWPITHTPVQAPS